MVSSSAAVRCLSARQLQPCEVRDHVGQTFNWDQFRKDIRVVRAMDNVIDRTIYPLEEQKQEAAKRRMGLGITGLANAGEMMAIYASGEFMQFMEMVATCGTRLRRKCRTGEREGPFLWDWEQYSRASSSCSAPAIHTKSRPLASVTHT